MIRRYLPSILSTPLFGNRELYGKSPWTEDKDWEKWLSIYPEVYFETQRKGGIQRFINSSGYNILKKFDLQGKTITEIGPGGGYHFPLFRGTPEKYNALDVCEDFFPNLQKKADQWSIPLKCYLLESGNYLLPLEASSQDVVLSFYSFEHLNPLEKWIEEIYRVLRPGGMFIGAVPAEGGLAWGLGRFLTSNRTLKKKFGLDIKKIVCWEHPNMIDEMLNGLNSSFQSKIIQKFPFPFLPLDLNLLVKFTFVK